MFSIKDEWENFKGTWKGQEEYDKFLKTFPRKSLETMTLDQYSSIKGNSADDYFTIG